MDGLIKKDIVGWIYKKWANTFLNHINLSGETLMSRLIDLSNYATKADLKNATAIDTSKFSAKFDLV